MTKLLIAALVTCASLCALTKDQESALRAQLAKAQADLVIATKINTETLARSSAAITALTVNLAKESRIAEARTAEANTNSRVVASAAVSTAKQQVEVAVGAANNASTAAAAASEQARVANQNNTSLLIIQGFTFLSLIAGFAYKGLERRWDQNEVHRKEALTENQRVTARDTAAETAKSTTERLEQIHVLVNSNFTRAIEGELDSRRANLALMQAAVASRRDLSQEPSPETLATIEAAKVRIAELIISLDDRRLQTQRALAESII